MTSYIFSISSADVRTKSNDQIGQEMAASFQRQRRPVCVECGRTFDLMDEVDAGDWFYGHDCEVA